MDSFTLGFVGNLGCSRDLYFLIGKVFFSVIRFSKGMVWMSLKRTITSYLKHNGPTLLKEKGIPLLKKELAKRKGKKL
ncbi:hypothetical protein CR203_21030 [Salipaludibacillus neizhouensis]|uniref:Uncharacterized protein n=1 Tax=Salipaludibacillus neizhouensis TaxID=885475 RepID=A0A3A9K4Q7_9BACI|nr:hypothetical protein CR203_21030 [Salipaludibacillus neizhouensis]